MTKTDELAELRDRLDRACRVVHALGWVATLAAREEQDNAVRELLALRARERELMAEPVGELKLNGQPVAPLAPPTGDPAYCGRIPVEPEPASGTARCCEACPDETSRTDPQRREWKYTVCGKRWKDGALATEPTKVGFEPPWSKINRENPSWFGHDQREVEPTKPAKCKHGHPPGAACGFCLSGTEPTPVKPADGERERERDAWAIHCAGEKAIGRVLDSWEGAIPDQRAFALASYDKAEAIFAAKAEGKLENARRAHDSTIRAWQKAEQERDEQCHLKETAQRAREIMQTAFRAARAEVDRAQARVDDYQRANASLEEGLAYQTAEAKRLADQVDELVEALRDVLDNSRAQQARNDQYVEPCRAYTAGRELLARMTPNGRGGL